MPNINKILTENQCRIWYIEQSIEASFMPSIIQNVVEIDILFVSNKVK